MYSITVHHWWKYKQGHVIMLWNIWNSAKVALTWVGLTWKLKNQAFNRKYRLALNGLVWICFWWKVNPVLVSWTICLTLTQVSEVSGNINISVRCGLLHSNDKTSQVSSTNWDLLNLSFFQFPLPVVSVAEPPLWCVSHIIVTDFSLWQIHTSPPPSQKSLRLEIFLEFPYPTWDT